MPGVRGPMNLAARLVAGAVILTGPGRAADPSPAGRVVAEGYARRTVYHSPQTPGYTCWVGAWAMPDQSLMVCFTQATGPVKDRPRAPAAVIAKLGMTGLIKMNPDWDFTGLDLRNVYLRSADGGATWREVGSDPFRTPGGQMSQGGTQVGLPDGTILRAAFGYHLPLDPVPQTGYLERSTDGGKTWGGRQVLIDPEKSTYRITRMGFLRDGRLLATGGLARTRSGDVDENQLTKLWEPLLMVSADNGKTWGEPQALLSAEQRKGWVGEEWDTAELPTGDLLAVFRRHDPKETTRQVRWQGLLTKRGSGWVLDRLGPAGLPHSGHPDLLATREGVVLHTATSGLHWTVDAGASWHPVEFPGGPKAGYRSNYYPIALQLADGRIRVFSHAGGHDPYGGRDQSVTVDTFHLVRSPGK